MTAADAAEYLTEHGCPCRPSTVLRWARIGVLKRLRTPGRGRVNFTEQQLQRFLADLEHTGPSPSPRRQPRDRKPRAEPASSRPAVRDDIKLPGRI